MAAAFLENSSDWHETFNSGVLRVAEFEVNFQKCNEAESGTQLSAPNYF